MERPLPLPGFSRLLKIFIGDPLLRKRREFGRSDMLLPIFDEESFIEFVNVHIFFVDEVKLLRKVVD